MEPCSLKFVVEACAGELVAGSPGARVTRVSTDSRGTQAGDLFVALGGERFDGHVFWPEARRRGAVALVAARSRLPANLSGAVIAVDDTRRALGRLAAGYRSHLGTPALAVGGSNGKTTTKELLAAVLRQKRRTWWSAASFNNDIGVPLTLLGLERSHELAVIEVGTNHPGELEPLVRLVQPRWGVITSIGREHLEFFGDLTGVAAEEGVLAERLPADGTLFVIGDGPWGQAVARRTSARVVRVGVSADNDWRVREARVSEAGTDFSVEGPAGSAAGDYRIRLVGRHQAVNALFAVAVGTEFGLSPAEIQLGLAECAAPKMRLQFWVANGVRVLDDAYNANADSTLAALQTLRELPCAGRRIAVLGDMAELGAHSEAAHLEVGRRVAELRIEQLVAVGKMAGMTAAAARAAGLGATLEFSEVEQAAAAVSDWAAPGDTILLKASRVMRLERIGEALRGGRCGGARGASLRAPASCP